MALLLLRRFLHQCLYELVSFHGLNLSLVRLLVAVKQVEETADPALLSIVSQVLHEGFAAVLSLSHGLFDLTLLLAHRRQVILRMLIRARRRKDDVMLLKKLSPFLRVLLVN